MGYNPFEALKIFFISPISNAYGISELFIKATPLALIAVGLSFCFKNNIYNIGAEGQLTMGAIFGGGVGIFFHDVSSLLPDHDLRVPCFDSSRRGFAIDGLSGILPIECAYSEIDGVYVSLLVAYII